MRQIISVNLFKIAVRHQKSDDRIYLFSILAIKFTTSEPNRLKH